MTLTVCQIVFVTRHARDVGLNVHLILVKFARDTDRAIGSLHQKFHFVITKSLVNGEVAHFAKSKINTPSNGGLPGIRPPTDDVQTGGEIHERVALAYASCRDTAKIYSGHPFISSLARPSPVA